MEEKEIKTRNEFFLFDLSKEQLEKRIVKPLLSNQMILVRHRLISPTEVVQVNIVETNDKSSNLFKRAIFKDITGSEKNFEDNRDKLDFLTDLGKDITPTILNKKYQSSPKTASLEKIRPKLNDIFIAHGRDKESALELKVFLYELGLHPIILSEQPAEGRTIIEKLQKFLEVGYAFVILTPDDFGVTYDQLLGDTLKIKDLRRRARQNVIFEFGILVGILGSRRVCCLLKRGTEIPSDINGLKYILFENSVSEARYYILEELKAAGYKPMHFGKSSGE